MSCSYAGQTIGAPPAGNFHSTTTFPIARTELLASVNFNGGTIRGTRYLGRLHHRRQFTNNTMTANMNEKLSFNYQGLPIDCATGDQTRIATRTG